MKHPSVNSVWNISIFQKINPVIRILIFSDILVVMTRLGFIAPIFALYITDKIPGGNLEVVGIATTIYMLSKSLLQIPVSVMIDKIKGEKDDFIAIFLGTLWFSLTPLLYIFIDSIFQLYVVQFLLGVSAAVLFPSWTAVFTRHIDHEHEGIEWGTYFTVTDLSSAIGAALGGIIAYRLGFNYLFGLASVISFIGVFVLLSIKNDMRFVRAKK